MVLKKSNSSYEEEDKVEVPGLDMDHDDNPDDEERTLDMKRKTKVVEESPKGRYVRFNEKLGEGAFKKVYRAWDTSNGVEVAWNAVRMSTLQRRDGGKRILQEMRILQKLDHPNIIKFYASWLKKEEQTLVFVTEIITTGTLKAFVESRPVRLNILKRWCRHILGAIVYLHSFDPPIIHRDLKCDNIFINGSTGDIRIGDLGLASWQRDGEAQSCLGTPEYMAPELYEENYDEQVDIYAFGMCVLEMITKQMPYQECTSAPQIYRKVIKGVLPHSFSTLKECSTTRFIRRCIGKPSDGRKRPTAQQLLEGSYLERAETDEDDSVDCATFIMSPEQIEIARAAQTSKAQKAETRQPRKTAITVLDNSAAARQANPVLIRRTTSPSLDTLGRPCVYSSRSFLSSKSQMCVELLTPSRRSIKFVLLQSDTGLSIANELIVEKLIKPNDVNRVGRVLEKSMKIARASEAKSIDSDKARRRNVANDLNNQVAEVKRDIEQLRGIQDEESKRQSSLKNLEEKLTGEYNNFLANR